MTQTVDDYINGVEGETRQRLLAMRTAVLNSAPDIEESIAYGMPAYKLRGKPLVYYAAFPNHIGFYATPNGHEAFKKDFALYKQGKGSVQFPHDKPLPLALIKRVVQFRVEQLTK
ncbi:MAG: DUF1801 domain-containing protein [Candidatus Saccharimonas aalborgensis]